MFHCDVYQEDQMTKYEGLITLGHGSAQTAPDAVRAAISSVNSPGFRPTPESIVGGDWTPSQSYEGWEKQLADGKLIVFIYTVDPRWPRIGAIGIEERVEEDEMSTEEADAIIAEGLSILS